MGNRRGAIGIFDSGVGGLTVLGRIAERLPGESIIYLGDTARVPYGTKSADTVIRYARACANVLLDRGIKLLIVACNTASAYALDALRSELAIPVVGVIAPGAQRAARETKNQRIGVIGTAGTIASGAYVDAVRAVNASARVVCAACPLFVPLAEEGWTSGAVPRQVAENYLGPLVEQGIDTLVLGCTHYPLLRNVIGETVGPAVRLVDSAESTAEVVADTVASMGIAGPAITAPRRQFLVSDAPDAFATVGKRFLGQDIEDIEWVDF